MTSYFVPGLLVGYALGVASMCGLVGLYLLHRPRYVAPTMHNKKWRDAAGTEFQEVPATVKREAKAMEDGIRYEWINLTGLEDK
jgi:hypothetical protein